MTDERPEEAPLSRRGVQEEGERQVGSADETKVVHCKRERYDVYIGRPSKWGNPFVVGKDGSREQVIAKYRAWVVSQPELMASVSELKGKTLGCWCKPEPCHGDVLAELTRDRDRTESRADIPQRDTRRARDRELDDLIKQQDEKRKAKERERVPERSTPDDRDR